MSVTNILESVLSLFRDWAGFAFWQSIFVLGIALIVGRFLRRCPWCVHLLLISGIFVSILTPSVSLWVFRSNAGMVSSGALDTIENPIPALTGVLGPVILLGGFLCAIVFLYDIIAARRLMFQAKPFPNRDLQEALLEGAKTMRNISLPILFTSTAVKSPTVWSWGLHPAVVLPESLSESLNPEERDGIFLHELAHITRRDHWAAFLVRLCGVGLFWNPLYWFALRYADLNADKACDLLVLSQEKISLEMYSETILRLASREKIQPVFQHLSRKEQLMKRIDTILDFEENPKRFSVTRNLRGIFGTLIAAVLLTTALAFCQEKQNASLENVKTYRVDKKVTEFPENQIDLSTPEATYALCNRIIAGNEPDKISSLQLYTVNRSVPENFKNWIQTMTSDDMKKIGEAMILKVFIYKNRDAMVVAEVEPGKKYNTRMLSNENGRWFNIGGGGFFKGESSDSVVKMCENLFQGLVKRWEEETPEKTWKTPDQAGYTHLVEFEPSGEFHPQNAKELLDKLNEHFSKRNEILTGYFRTSVNDKGEIIGKICTTNPSKFKEVMESIPELKLIKMQALDQKMFEDYIGKKIIDTITPDAESAEEAEKTADALISRFAKNDFSDTGFTDAMKQSNISEINKTLWTDFTKQFGKFIETKTVKTESVARFKRVHQNCEFENGNVVYMVVVDKDNNIAGLFVMSIEKKPAPEKMRIIERKTETFGARIYSVNKTVTEFPEKADLSTPEAAYAAYARALSFEDEAAYKKEIIRLSAPALRTAFERVKKFSVDPEWGKVLLAAKILSVSQYEDNQAVAVAKLEGKNVQNPYDARYFEKIDGQWLNTGNDRFDSPEEAQKKLLQIMDYKLTRKTQGSVRSLIPLLNVENVKSYRVDKKIAEFPNEINLSTPENAYATGKYLIVSSRADKVEQLEKMHYRPIKIPERERKGIETLTDPEFRKKYINEFNVFEVILVGKDKAFVFGYREYDQLYDGNYFQKKEDGLWYNMGNEQSEEAEEFVNDIRSFIKSEEYKNCTSLEKFLKHKPEKSYRIDKKIAEFPDEFNLKTPELAYATQKHLIVSNQKDKADLLYKMNYKTGKMSERESSALSKPIDEDWAKTYKSEFVVYEVYQFSNEYAFVFSKREFDDLFDGNFFRKKDDGLWYNLGNYQDFDPKEMARDVDNAVKRFDATYFSVDPEGGRKLDALMQASDKGNRSVEEIVETLRNGLLTCKSRKDFVLNWFGNKYIWGINPQNEKAIQFMLEASRLPDQKIYYNAIYFGLSVVKKKTPEIIQAMADVAMKTDDYINVVWRVQWGCRSLEDKAALLKCIDAYMESEDENVRTKAENVLAFIDDPQGWFIKDREAKRQKAKEEFGPKFPELQKQLIEGDSQTRMNLLQEFYSNYMMMLAFDDSFMASFEACAKDSDPRVRSELARLVGDSMIWTRTEQSEKAIALMREMLKDSDSDVRYNAVYHGLAAVHSPSDELIATLLRLIIDHRDPKLVSRIAKGLSYHKKNVQKILDAWKADEKDETKRKQIDELVELLIKTNHKLPDGYFELRNK